MIAKYKPQAMVVAVSRVPATVRAMQLYWGVFALKWTLFYGY